MNTEYTIGRVDKNKSSNKIDIMSACTWVSLCVRIPTQAIGNGGDDALQGVRINKLSTMFARSR